MQVLLVDDSPIFRYVARSLLERRGYEVVGEAAGSMLALGRAEELRPAAALVDVRLPDGSGFDLASELKRRLPRIAVVLMSTEDDGTCHAWAEACGARGFVLKSHLAACDLSRFWPER